MSVEAVIFDWGGTLSVWVDIDIEDMWREAAGHHLDAWTPHIRHHPEAAAILRRLKENGFRLGLLSNTHWPRQFHERFPERDGLAGLIDARFYTSEMEY